MSDQVAPAVAKVVATEAHAKGPAMDSDKINIAIIPPAPTAKTGEAPADAPVAAPEKSEQPVNLEKAEGATQPETPEESKHVESKAADTLEPAAAHTRMDGKPKPVQIQSVPETPANTANSVNGTPRPELNLSAMVIDPEKPSEDESSAVIVEPVEAGAATAAPNADESIADKPAKQNGAPFTAEMTGALQTAQAKNGPEPAQASNGKKRKLDDDDGPGDDESDKKKGSEEDPRANKKAKVETEAQAQAEAKTNGRPIKKPGRPRKDKSKPRVVGQTQRKTRSQGPAEVQSV